MTFDEFNQVCEQALKGLSAVENRMREQEKRLDKAFNDYETKMQNLIKQTEVVK